MSHMTPRITGLKGRYIMDFGIVGIRNMIGVKSKKTGQDLNAYILQLVRENPRDDRLKGCECKQQFVDAALLAADIQKLGGYGQLVGMHININYDDGGFIDYVELKPGK